MDLADVESTPRAIEKAALWVSSGLEHVARANAVGAAEVLRRLPMERLFRVGASLDPERAKGPPEDPDGPLDPDPDS